MKYILLFLMIGLSMVGAAQNEQPDRGLVVAKGKAVGHYFASWRLLESDPKDATFTLLRDGKPYKENISGATSLEVEGTPNSLWQVVLTTNNKVQTSKSKAQCSKLNAQSLMLNAQCSTLNAQRSMPWRLPYLKLRISPPANKLTSHFGEKAGGGVYTPNDMSVGDVDGDGQYELFVKWSPYNEHDNSGDGYTDDVYIACYKLDMVNPNNDPKCLWMIDLGKNIRGGAHYTQFMVADFDGDGKAEMMCKTAPGSVDGKGQFVSAAANDKTILNVENTKDWRNHRGRIYGGQEYLTVFSGEDGHAINTVFYEPNRNMGIGGDAIGTVDWNTSKTTHKRIIDNGQYGNRCERYLACVAYLDGMDKNPCAIFTRGYYTYAFAWAVSFDGKQIHTKWLHKSLSGKNYSVVDANGRETSYTATPPTSGKGSGTLFGNGNHNLTVADVDGDGRDEMIWGAAALDDDGKVLYATGYGHGDAVHLADLIPSRPGYEVFDIHENLHTDSWDIHDARTGEILFHGADNSDDNGRGLAAQIDSSTKDYYFWSAVDPTIRNAANGKVALNGRASMNFRIYWDGDLHDELLDGTNIQKLTSNGRKTLGIWGEVNPKESVDIESFREGRRSRRRWGFMRSSVSFHGYGNPASNNWTKNNPCLQCDLFGDWREELIYRDADDPSIIYIYMSQIPTTHRMTTLMQNHIYRMGIAWQNVAYNQPPYCASCPDASLKNK